MKKLLPFAKGVSVKDRVWDDKGKSHPLDYNRMLKLVHASGFRGYCGIEVVGYANLTAKQETPGGHRQYLMDHARSLTFACLFGFDGRPCSGAV